MTNLEYITDELKNEMKMHVTDSQQFDTWISILKPLNLYNGTLYLEVPKKDTLFIYDKIWAPQLQIALDNIKSKTGKDLIIEIVAKDGDNYNKVLTLGKDYDPDGPVTYTHLTLPTKRIV